MNSLFFIPSLFYRMKIWLVVALLIAVALSAAASVKHEDKEAKVFTEVIKADLADSTLASTDITETDEDFEATETQTSKATTVERKEHTKEKAEKVRQKGDGEHEKEENEENENEENENEEEDSDEEESEEEDSEESEGNKSLKKKITKSESEEENNDNKTDAVEIPSLVPARSRPVDSLVAIQPHQPVDTSRSGSRMSKSENFFSPTKSSYGSAGGQQNPRPETGEILMEKSSAVEFPFWHTPVAPAKSFNEERRVSPSVEFHLTEERKTKHPKWFFNTPKSKPSDDSSTKKESSKPFVAEGPVDKPADVQVSVWPVTRTRPAVRGSHNLTISQSDHGNSQSKWFFNVAPKSSDGFGRKVSRQHTDIEKPMHPSTIAQSEPWSKPVIPSPALSTAHVPVHNAAEVFQPPTRKVYPRWFFNIKD